MAEAAYLTATRRSYDTVAVDHERLPSDQLARTPLGRAVLAGWVEGVEAAGGPRTIAGLGCGTGRVTSRPRRLGAEAFGVDLSPGMTAVARTPTRNCASTWAP
ncbi:class I SAM-dependent methyltransferase [Streptomyces sp. NPDC058877]|uniref:class I SAM-dependent methyltransferase n=1 Tax=unclassified Streptomyces TaxID=2593676 RepID=UPI0036CFFB08